MDPEKSVIFLDTDTANNLSDENRDDKQVSNDFEATCIVRLVAQFVAGGAEQKSLGVLSPYNKQLEVEEIFLILNIRKILNSKKKMTKIRNFSSFEIQKNSREVITTKLESAGLQDVAVLTIDRSQG